MKKDTKALIFDVFWECVAQNVIAVEDEYKYIIEEYPEAILDYLYDAEDPNWEVYNKDFARAIALYNMESGKYELMTQEKLCILYTIRCALYDVAFDLKVRREVGKPAPLHTIPGREPKPDDRFERKVMVMWRETLKDMLKNANSSLIDNFKDFIYDDKMAVSIKKMLATMMSTMYYIPSGAMMEILFREIMDKSNQCVILAEIMQECIAANTPLKLTQALREICIKNYIE